MEKFRKYLPDLLAVVLFAVLAFAYFMPADFEGRILYQHDASAGRGAGQEALEYLQRTGERTRWTNATFSGMPTYQTAPSYHSTEVLAKVSNAYHLWLPENVWYVFAYLLGFYIFVRVLQMTRNEKRGARNEEGEGSHRARDVMTAILGAIVWAFSSYFFIIIAAGHIWKVWALAYLPPMIAGVVLAYRGRYLWGFIVTALFAAFEIYANHVQMTYYYLFIILFMVVAFFVQALKEHRLARFLKATAVCAVAGLVGVLMNISSLYHTWQYSQETMRGKSELVKANAADQTAGGLDRSYITQYSYGIGETWSLLVPNVKGGTSAMALGASKIAQKEGNSHFFDIDGQQVPYSYLYNQMPQYWNETTLDRKQPGTSGPVYVGAFVMFLFVLGLFIVRSPLKWALLAVTVLSVLLSWGQNFMGLTNFFIDHLPMYAKFRAVESILVIAEFCIPVLAIMALMRLLDDPSLLLKRWKSVCVSLALTAGMVLLFALMPSLFFNFTTNGETAQFSEMLGSQAVPFMENLQKVRQAIFAADCWRSVGIIVVGVLILFLYAKGRLRASYMVGLLALLCLVDMWMVDKRYLHDSMFVERSVRETPQPMTATDELILQDKSLDYRVLNLAGDTFNENNTSYYHKSIGGYHAAKLRRYQELIDACIVPEMKAMMPAIADAQGDMTQVAGDSLYPVLNMLNMKYVIMPLQHEQTVPIMNPYAYGNAWFVDRLTYVGNANDEIETVKRLDLRHEAVADAQFKEQLGEAVVQDTVSLVTLISYEPNELHYNVRSGKGGIVVFSEIYYPGWNATVDGQPAELGRVNYVLRAMKLSAGEHEVVLTFKPASIHRTETIAYVASGMLLLAILGGVIFRFRKRKK